MVSRGGDIEPHAGFSVSDDLCIYLPAMRIVGMEIS
jgi:hypothetical protein